MFIKRSFPSESTRRPLFSAFTAKVAIRYVSGGEAGDGRRAPKVEKSRVEEPSVGRRKRESRGRETGGRPILRPERFSGDLPATAAQRRNIQTTFLRPWWRLACMYHRWLHGGGYVLPLALSFFLAVSLSFSLTRRLSLFFSPSLDFLLYLHGQYPWD